MTIAGENYEPHKHLRGIYRQADELDDEGMAILCPSYSELASVAQRYAHEELIGKGALKEVYRCFDCRTKRLIALARPRAEHDADCYDDFVHEAWLVSRLRHPNIIKVHDAGIDADKRPFFTMDLKGNTTLEDLVKQAPDRRSLLVLFLKICDAIAYAHSVGIIHRDLKPENIQCDRFGEVLVCDWGLGKAIRTEDGETANEPTLPLKPELSGYLVSHTGIKGTPGYMAPEQILGDSSVDEHSDIFALGCLLHFILTGSAPFTGTPEEIMKKTAGSHRQSLRSLHPGKKIPKGLDAVTLKAIARNPAERYQSVTGLQEDIHRHLAGHSTSAERPGLARRCALFIKRNRTPCLIAASALVILGVAGGVFKTHLDRKEEETNRMRSLNEQLGSEFDDLSTEYQVLLSQTEEPRRVLANRLLVSAIQKKKFSVFEEPRIPLRQVLQLIERVLKLDPDSKEAQFQHFSTHSIMLNFVEAMKYPVDPGHPQAGYNAYAQAFPTYQFTETDRPEIDELTEFFHRAKEIGSGHDPLMTAILTYDADTRSDKTHYAKVVGAALEYMWQDHPDLTVEYQQEAGQLTVRSSQEIANSSQDVRRVKVIVRFLEVDTLTLQVNGSFDLACLGQASVRRLDLTGLKQPILRSRALVNDLEEVVVRRKQVGKPWLDKLLTSDGLSQPKLVVVD